MKLLHKKSFSSAYRLVMLRHGESIWNKKTLSLVGKMLSCIKKEFKKQNKQEMFLKKKDLNLMLYILLF